MPNSSPYSYYYDYHKETGWGSQQPTIDWGDVIFEALEGVIGSIGLGKTHSFEFRVLGSTVVQTAELNLVPKANGVEVQNWKAVLDALDLPEVDFLLTILPVGAGAKMILAGIKGGITSYISQLAAGMSSTELGQLISNYSTSNAVDMRIENANGSIKHGIYYFNGITETLTANQNIKNAAVAFTDLANLSSIEGDDLIGAKISFTNNVGDPFTGVNPLIGKWTIYDGSAFDDLVDYYYKVKSEDTISTPFNDHDSLIQLNNGQNANVFFRGFNDKTYFIAREGEGIQGWKDHLIVNANGKLIHPHDIYREGDYGIGQRDSLFIGDEGNNTLIAHQTWAGADIMLGLGGNDSLEGHKGNDEIYGDAKVAGDSFEGNDTLIGGEGHNKLVGGLGEDYLSYDWLDLTGVRIDILSASDFTNSGSQTIEEYFNVSTQSGYAGRVTKNAAPDMDQELIDHQSAIVLNDEFAGIERIILPDSPNMPNGLKSQNSVYLNSGAVDNFKVVVGDSATVRFYAVSDRGGYTELLHYNSYIELTEGTTEIQLFGTELAETLVGSDSSNFLAGQQGDDTIIGSMDNDTIHGGTPDDASTPSSTESPPSF